MNTPYSSRYTAFVGDRRLAQGAYADIARALASLDDAPQPVLVFDDATGAPVDAPPRPEHAARLARIGITPDGASAAAPEAPRPAPGRPRLGVVAREVTLLPRHWDWLAAQPGGASVALRKLVEDARKVGGGEDRRRAAQEATYRFMQAMAGDFAGYEDVARALFAGDIGKFEQHSATWPEDVRDHAALLAADAFHH